jgi:hypothetical protein
MQAPPYHITTERLNPWNGSPELCNSLKIRLTPVLRPRPSLALIQKTRPAFKPAAPLWQLAGDGKVGLNS